MTTTKTALLDRFREHCTIEEYPDRDAWLAARMRGIGASEVGAILGYDPWRSPLSVYADKRGLVESEPQSEAAELGLALEPVIAARYAKLTGRVVVDLGPYIILRSKEHPWLGASLDRLAFREDGALGNVELKSALSPNGTRDWEDEPPLRHQFQAQTQMLVAHLTWASLTALLAGPRTVFADLAPHDKAREVIVRATYDFWVRVEKQDPPPADASSATTEVLKRLYPRPVPGTTIALPEEAAEWDRRRLAAIVALKAAEQEKDETENLLRQAIGDHEAGRIPGGALYTNKAQTQPAYTVERKECTFRVLRRSEKKG